MTKLRKLNVEMMESHLLYLAPTTKNGLIVAIPERKEDKRPPKILFGSISELLDKIIELNNDEYGIFILVNETEGIKRKAKDIIRVRAIFHDDDGDGKQLPLPPSLIIESGGVTKDGRKKRHSYYFTTDQLTHEDYLGMMPILAGKYGGDPVVKDLPRLMRLAGTYHWKTGNPRCVKIVKVGKKYTRDDLLAAFPPDSISKNKDKKPNNKGGAKTLAQCRVV